MILFGVFLFLLLFSIFLVFFLFFFVFLIFLGVDLVDFEGESVDDFNSLCVLLVFIL